MAGISLGMLPMYLLSSNHRHPKAEIGGCLYHISSAAEFYTNLFHTAPSHLTAIENSFYKAKTRVEQK